MPDPLALLLSPFMLRALIASVITAVMSATIGSFTVIRGLSTMGAAVAHASLAGALLAFVLGLNPLLGAAILSIMFAVAAAYAGERSSGRIDVMLGVVFGFSAALAAFALSLTREYTVAAYTFLLGEVLGVSDEELMLLSTFAYAVLVTLYVFYKEFKLTSFDPEGAVAMGLNARFYHYLMLILIATTIVVELKTVGSILAVVFLVAPSAAALEYSHSIEKTIAFSILFAVAAAVIGVILSATLNLPTSPTIGLIASLNYLFSLIASPKRRKCCKIKK